MFLYIVYIFGFSLYLSRQLMIQNIDINFIIFIYENEDDTLKESECVPIYEDKDGDWMLAGDVPWE